MKKLIQLKSAVSSREQGFITMEVIVGILVAFFFLMGAMQSLVYAMAIKVQAQEKQRASQLITGDIELANNLANSSDLAGTCNPANYDNGYGKGLQTALTTADPIPKEFLLSNNTGTQLALFRDFITPVVPDDAPYRTLKIKYQVWWGESGGNYLDRSGAVKDASDKPIAETYVEIIPDVALACP
jgi:hypothetical protein